MNDHITNQEKLDLLMNHNMPLPPNLRPGYAIKVVCHGDEVARIHPREWKGEVSLTGELIRPLVSGADLTGVQVADDGRPIRLSRVKQRALTRSTEMGRLITKPLKPSQEPSETDPIEVSHWRVTLKHRCGENLTVRLDKLMAIATRLADADVSEVSLQDLRSILSP